MSKIFLPFLQPVKGQLVTLHVFFSPVCPAVLLLSAWDVEYYAGDDDEDGGDDEDCDDDEDGDDSEEVDDDDRRIIEFVIEGNMVDSSNCRNCPACSCGKWAKTNWIPL